MRIFFFLFKKILRKGTRIINAYSWVGLKICRHIQIRNRLAVRIFADLGHFSVCFLVKCQLDLQAQMPEKSLLSHSV